MTVDKFTKISLCLFAPLIGLIIIREIPIGYSTSDNYYYKRIFFDFFQGGSAWDEMYFGPAPGFFTNMLPLFIEDLFIEHLTRIFLFHICLYGMVTGVVIWLIARAVSDDRITTLFVVLLSILLIIVVGSENSYWNRPSHHYGSVINLLIAMYLMVVARNSWWGIPLIYLVVIMTVVSDFLYIPVYCAMTAGIILVYWRTGEASFRQALIRGIVLAVPVGLGVVLHYIVTPNVVANPVWASGLSIREVFTSPATHVRAFKFLFIEGARLPVYWLSILLGMSAWLFMKHRGTASSRFLYFFVAIQFVIWGNIYLSGLGDFRVSRYRLFAVNGACILIALSLGVLALDSGRVAFKRLAMVSLLAFGLYYLIWPDRERVDYVKKVDEVYFEFLNQAECIQEVVLHNSLKAGIAGFKDANRFTALTKGDVFLFPVKGRNVTPLKWHVSEVGLKREYDFALVTTNVDDNNYKDRKAYYPLSKQVVEAAYGPPVKAALCGDKEIIMYEKISFGSD